MASIDPFWGSLLTLLVCGILPLCFYQKAMTIYDVLSGALVSLSAALLLAAFPAALIIPLSYLAFGLMWNVSVCLRIPLSAPYSMAGRRHCRIRCASGRTVP